jgi:S-DNA-T family DNA segregation ATPase FtsK/SpoIIIE
MERIDQAAALHRQAAAVAQAATRALDEHVPMPRTDLAEQQDLALRLRQTAALLTPGWLGADLHDGKSPSELGERRRPEFVRIGDARPLEQVDFPAVIPLLGTGHLTFSADSRDPRVAGALRSVLLRLLATAPAGTLIVRAVDAVGGALFAPFGALADAGVMPPAVTDRVGLNAVLSEAEHWVLPSRPNDQRKPSTRPRRRDCTMLLLIAALPSAASSEELNRIFALAEAGPAAGLHIVAAGWPPMPFSHRPALPPLPASTQVSLRTDYALIGGMPFATIPEKAAPEKPRSPSPTEVWAGLNVPVRLDPDPPARMIQRVCAELAERFAAQGQIHVMDLLPDPDHWWAESSAEGMSTTVGLAGETPVSLHFTDLTPHWLVGGRPGAGKTAFLINVLYGLCTRYDPEELQLYLVDCSEGGALRQFTPTEDDPSWLPHAVDVSVDSDRGSALAVLRSLDRELHRRIAMLNDAGATRFHQLRAAGAPIPRIVCVIDEFQKLLTGTDDIATESAALLESVSRQGRAAGMHLVMCSQRARSSPIFAQFLVRVALPGGGDVLEATNDSAASLPLGRAVVNTAGGLGGPRGATRGHEKTVRFPDPHADEQVLAALRQRLWQAREPASAPPHVHSHVPSPRIPNAVDQEAAHE